MLKMFGYLKSEKFAVLTIIFLLVIQAYCDLSLPQYTSDIVDVGIQQGGIDNVAPNEIRTETLDTLAMFMTDEDAAYVKDYYVLNEDGNYELNTKDKDVIDKLDTIFGIPMVFVSTMDAQAAAAATTTAATTDTTATTAATDATTATAAAATTTAATTDTTATTAATDATTTTASVAQQPAVDSATLKTMYDNGMVTKEQLLTMKDDALAKYGDISDSIIAQKALLFVKAEYIAMGINLDTLQTQYLWTKGFQMLGFAVVIMISAIIVGFLAAKTAAKVGMTLRGNVFKKVVSFSNKEIDEFSTASLITRSTNDIQQVQMVTVLLLRMVAYAPILGIGGVIKVIGTHTGMGWIIGVAVGVILLFVGTLMVIAMPKFKKMQTLIDRLNLVSREILTGTMVIRAFSREKFEEKRFEKANQDLMSTQLFTNRVMTFMMPFMMLVMNCITVLIVWVGAKGINLGNLQVGDMMAFMTYTMQIVMSFLMLTMISILLPRAAVAAGRINEIINTPVSIKDKDVNLDKNMEKCTGLVKFEDVSFRYPNADEDALEHLTFTAKPGETTAIIGSTGCGKSTLIQLIPRFYDVKTGKVTIDGIDVRDLSLSKLHSLLGYVPQRGVLFSGDIESNIKFGGDFITDEEMIEAARVAQATEFISEKQDTYQSQISQGGTNVSGGQKQRLSIARAIAKAPQIYIFDDSFSALDYKTDVTLRRALKEKTADATVIIVAQRISTVLHADQIIVLEEGKIVGIGNHESLLKTSESYLEIAKSQLSEEELKGGKA